MLNVQLWKVSPLVMWFTCSCSLYPFAKRTVLNRLRYFLVLAPLQEKCSWSKIRLTPFIQTLESNLMILFLTLCEVWDSFNSEFISDDIFFFFFFFFFTANKDMHTFNTPTSKKDTFIYINSFIYSLSAMILTHRKHAARCMIFWCHFCGSPPWQQLLCDFWHPENQWKLSWGATIHEHWTVCVYVQNLTCFFWLLNYTLVLNFHCGICCFCC